MMVNPRTGQAFVKLCYLVRANRSRNGNGVAFLTTIST
jgi:hypothetical protein